MWKDQQRSGQEYAHNIWHSKLYLMVDRPATAQLACHFQGVMWGLLVLAYAAGIHLISPGAFSAIWARTGWLWAVAVV